MPTCAKTLFPFLAFTLFFFALLGCGEDVSIHGLKLVEVGPFSATLEWHTDSPASETVFYGEGTLLDRETQETESAISHRVTLTGLKPATRYSYRIGEDGSIYSFRSAPGSDGSFDLAVLDANAAACRPESTQIDTPPDIVVLYGPCQGALGNHPESILTIHPAEEKQKRLSFGNALLDLYDRVPSVPPSVDPATKKGNHHIVVLPAVPEEPAAGFDRAILISPRKAKAGDITLSWETAETAWIEVDAFEVAWVQGGTKDRIRRVIVEAPPETKKTCLYCDRLMESGRYEESLSWYRDFIERESKMYQLEDAYFAIARILDEKLFRYAEALDAYQEFLDYFPQSRKKVLAKYRMDYLLTHDDHNYNTLAQFEQAKARLVRADPLPAVEKVEALVAQYPDSPVSAEALYWMGNLLQESHPDRARNHFRTLIQRFPKQENALVAAIALGDILYREKHYRQSRDAYRNALAIAPASYQVSITEKLRKSIRNIRREQIRWSAWVILAAWLAASVFLKTLPSKTDILAAVLTLAAYAFAAGIYFAVAYERAIPFFTPVTLLGLFTALILLWNRSLSRRITRLRSLFVMAHAFTCSASAVYLTLYHVHQIYLFGI